MSGRNKRTHFDFTLQAGVRRLDYSDLLVNADVQLQLANDCLGQGDIAQAAARVLAAREAIAELRHRGDQLRLRM